MVRTIGAYITSENYPNDYVIGDSYSTFRNCDVSVHLGEDEAIVLTFEDFELKRSQDELRIYDTLISNTSYLKNYLKHSTLDKMTPVKLSGNNALIRLRTQACSPYNCRCRTETGRGFKIKVGVGKWDFG